jgi:hypothetical protein
MASWVDSGVLVPAAVLAATAPPAAAPTRLGWRGPDAATLSSGSVSTANCGAGRSASGSTPARSWVRPCSMPSADSSTARVPASDIRSSVGSSTSPSAGHPT